MGSSQEIRGGHFIHNLHFSQVLGLQTPSEFMIKKYIDSFQNYFCPFTCLTKGDYSEIRSIIDSESYLYLTSYTKQAIVVKDLLEYSKKPNDFIYGCSSSYSNGFPLTYLLQGAAYIIAASTGIQIKGKRVLGNYLSLLKNNSKYNIIIELPDRGTCLLMHNNKYGVLIGYVNNIFNKKLIKKIHKGKVYLREPKFEECVKL